MHPLGNPRSSHRSKRLGLPWLRIAHSVSRSGTQSTAKQTARRSAEAKPLIRSTMTGSFLNEKRQRQPCHRMPESAEPSRALLWRLFQKSFAGSEDPMLNARIEHRIASKRLTAATARSAATATTAALARLVAVPAKDRAIAARLKRNCCRLAATRTNHRCSLCWSRTVAGAPLIVLLCLTAILATFRGRITTFLKERLIRSGEGEVLPAIAARK